MRPMIQLEILIATWNRDWLLGRTLASIAAARRPEGMELSVLVVDNNSTDQTRATVEQFAATTPFPVRYLFEKAQGKSYALNTGVAASSADLLGMIDDDEELALDWLEEVHKAFTDDPGLEFIGGPTRGSFEAEMPEWLPDAYPAILGVLNPGDEPATYTRDFPGVLPGGNAVIRRDALNRTRGYHTGLRRAQDVDMYLQLLDAGARGQYRPGLVILHHVPAERLTRGYFRRWAFAHGRSQGVLAGRHLGHVSQFAGVPRFRVRIALASLRRYLLGPFQRNGKAHPASAAFSEELRLREFAGLVVGCWRDRRESEPR